MIIPALASALALAAPDAGRDAQALVAAPTAAVSTAEGVISYPPDFFSGSQPTNAHEMLLRLPGFSIETGAVIRGFEGGGGNVLIDGQRPTSKTDDLEEILRRVPAGQVERIELIRGGAPGVDMQGKSVLANVIRKSGAGFRGLFAVSNNHLYDGRDLYGVRLELSGGDGGRNWETSVRYARSLDDGAGQGPHVKIAPDGRLLFRSDVDSEGDGGVSSLTGAYETPLLGGKARMNARVAWDDFKTEETDHVTFPGPDTQVFADVSNRFDTEIGGLFTRDFGARTSLELIGLRQTRDQDIDSNFHGEGFDARFGLSRESSETIARSVLKFRPTEQVSLELGAEGAFNALKSQTAYAENGAVVELPAANVEIEEKRGEVFAKAIWRPSSRWTLESGLRYEGSAISSDGDVHVEKTLYFAKPRFAASWAPSAATQVRFRFERVVGQLDFDDFVASSTLNTGVIQAGNPDLNPEQAWVSEAAVEQRFLGDGAVVLTLRHSALTDVIDRRPVFAANGDVFDTRANIGDGTKDELILNMTLPLDRFGGKAMQLKGEGTWRRSEVTDPTTGEDREISGLQPLEWEVTFTHDLPQWRTNWGVDVYGGWRESYYRLSEVEDRKLKTFVRPYVEWRARPDIVLRIEVNNITKRGFRNTRTVYDGPRNLNQIAYVEDRDIQVGRMYYVRIRKTFGA